MVRDEDRRIRDSRLAAGILALVGGVLVLTALAFLVLAIGPYLAAVGEHERGDLALWFVLVTAPIGLGGLATLLVAWGLRRDAAVAWAAAVGWALVASLVCALAFVAEGNLLSTVRRLLAGAGLSISGAQLYLTGPDGVTYGARLDTPTFWLPGLLVAATIAVLALFARSGREG